MYIEGYTNSENILADLVKTLCGDNIHYPNHQWKLEYPIGNIQDDDDIYRCIITNRECIISTEYSVDFITKTKMIEPDNIQIDEDFIIIDIDVVKNSPIELRYNNSILYQAQTKGNGERLRSDYYVEDGKIYLTKIENIDKTKFKITYGQQTEETTKFYIKFEYPLTFISRLEEPGLREQEENQNRFFIKWTFGKYLTDKYDVLSDVLYQVKPKECFCFWEHLNFSEDGLNYIDNSPAVMSLTYNMTYDNKTIAFLINNECSDNDIISFNYIGALENCKGYLTNESDNFGSSTNSLQRQDLPQMLITNPLPSTTKYRAKIIDYDVNNFSESTDFVTFRTVAGAFYQEHKIAMYSMPEFDINRYRKLTSVSKFTNTEMLSKIQLIHPYEQEQGYLRRVLTAPSTTGFKTTIEVNYDKKNEDFLYLKKGNINDIFKNSRTILNTILFQISN